MKILTFLILIINFHLNLINCCKENDFNEQLQLLSNCFIKDKSRSICECEEIIKDNFNSEKLKSWPDNSCKPIIEKFFRCYRDIFIYQFVDKNKSRSKICESCLKFQSIDFSDSFNLTKSLNIIESNLKQLAELQSSNQSKLELEKLNELQFKNLVFKDQYLIIIAFLISLLMVLIVWFILKYCQRTSSSNFNGPDLFTSSTPINNYSPINSMNNISPISLHDDQTRAALLEEVYGVDLPNYDKPPSYQEAVSNSYIKK